MVKVLENRVVDLDVMPGTKEHQEAAARAQELAMEEIPKAIPKDGAAAQNAANAGQAVVGALGGTLKGVVDTTGNTVGTLGEGLIGTVGGLGKGLGSGAMYAGSAVGDAGKGIGKGVGLAGDKNENTVQGNKKEEGEVGGEKGSERRESQHEDNVKALEDFEGNKGIKMDANE